MSVGLSTRYPQNGKRRNLRSSNAVDFNVPDRIPLHSFKNAPLSACNMTGHAFHCFRKSKRFLGRFCPVLFQFFGPATAEQFLHCKDKLASYNPFKSIKITLDKTLFRGGPRSVYKRELKNSYTEREALQATQHGNMLSIQTCPFGPSSATLRCGLRQITTKLFTTTLPETSAHKPLPYDFLRKPHRPFLSQQA